MQALLNHRAQLLGIGMHKAVVISSSFSIGRVSFCYLWSKKLCDSKDDDPDRQPNMTRTTTQVIHCLKTLARRYWICDSCTAQALLLDTECNSPCVISFVAGMCNQSERLHACNRLLKRLTLPHTRDQLDLFKFVWLLTAWYCMHAAACQCRMAATHI